MIKDQVVKQSFSEKTSESFNICSEKIVFLFVIFHVKVCFKNKIVWINFSIKYFH